MAATLKMGWAQADITPAGRVRIAGQFHIRLSEGVRDPITATALALERGSEQAVLVSCDLVTIADAFRDGVRRAVAPLAPGLRPEAVILNATHTHTGPETRMPEKGSGHTSVGDGAELDAVEIADYVAFAAAAVADAVARAWKTRAAGAVCFGLGHAVVGRNRRWTAADGVSTMYGDTNTPDFSHIEGYEDHGVGVIATLDPEGKLTGVVVNVACPSQVSEQDYELSADYWHDTRAELRRRLGAGLFVLPQCSAAGDQSPHILVGKAAESRMLELQGRSTRQEIAVRIADAVQDVLRYARASAQHDLELRRHSEVMKLPLRLLSEADVREANEAAKPLLEQHREALERLEAIPAARRDKRWYVEPTRLYRRAGWFEGVALRYDRQKKEPELSFEVHVLRLGDLAIATNPFEYFLDFGVHIRARSRAVQTFLVQLAGPGTYVPTERSVAGRSYGAVPASTPIGPDGGWKLAKRTVEVIGELWR
jgi:hypothetical protein